MRFFAALFALFVIIALVHAAPEPSEDCHDEALDITVKRGEVGYPEGKCVRVHCSEEGKTHVEPCEFSIGPNCQVVDGDLSKQFPSCCPTLKCDAE